MKRFFRLLLVALSIGILVTTVKIYLYESDKVNALQEQMSFLASAEDIEYISLEEEKRLEKKAKKEAEAEAKAEAERKAKEEEEAKKAEKERIQAEEEERKRLELEAAEEAAHTNKMDVPIICQLPEYKNGCEATSLTMMLNYAGAGTSKDEVISKISVDSTPISYDSSGSIKEWGNPEVGFVGDITGSKPGYSIDPVALISTVNEFLPGRALNLTGCDYEKIEEILLSGRPIVVWVNTTFATPSVAHTWTSNGVTVKGYKKQHAVLLTGIDRGYFYYNDPLTGMQNAVIEKETFKEVWIGMGRKALSYYK